MQPLAPTVVQVWRLRLTCLLSQALTTCYSYFDFKDFLHFIVKPNMLERSQMSHDVLGSAENGRETYDVTELNAFYDDEIGRPEDPVVKGLRRLNLETRWWKGLLAGSGEIGANLINGLSQKVL
jgi:hypothetical protein